MLLNHHILAKKSTDAVLSKFKTGEWYCCGERGIGFYRAGQVMSFPTKFLPSQSLREKHRELLAG